MNLRKILRECGKKYSDILGIKLGSRRESEFFKWFIASMFFGARITEAIAINTYKEFRKRKLLSYRNMKKASWQKLVDALDEGGYVRYDFSTADDLMACMKLLGKKYGGRVSRIHEKASGSRDLEERLLEFRGVGPVTAAIFLRDLRCVWKRAEPELTPLENAGARALGIKDVNSFWKKKKVRGYGLANLQTALMRLGRMKRKGINITELIK